MTRQELLHELLAKYGLSKDLPLRELMEFQSNNPEAYASFKSELGQLIGVDLSDDFGRTLLNDPEIQRAIEESVRREAGLE